MTRLLFIFTAVGSHTEVTWRTCFVIVIIVVVAAVVVIAIVAAVTVAAVAAAVVIIAGAAAVAAAVDVIAEVSLPSRVGSSSYMTS